MHSRIVIVHLVVLDVLDCASGHLKPHVHYYYKQLRSVCYIAVQCSYIWRDIRLPVPMQSGGGDVQG